MECEICGNEIQGKKNKVLMNEQELFVCSECSKFGSKVIEENEQQRKLQKFSKPVSKQITERQLSLDEGLEVAENYGLLVRKARESRKLTIAELAKKIFEKQSVIHKIESQKMLPSDSLIEKLEKNLSIKLRSK